MIDDAVAGAHASYFVPLKRRIYELWDPISIWQGLPAAVTASQRRRTIAITVRIDLASDGAVRSVAVLAGSGFPELDAEATRAVRAASPFAPPPAELTTAGAVAFPFSFYFELGRLRDGTRR